MKFISVFILSAAFLFLDGYAQNSNHVADQLYQLHHQFREQSIENRRFKQEDLLPLIQHFENDPQFAVRQVGSSIEERPLYLISVGNGDTDVLYWSQMHGDEPTATAAIFDVLNFLQKPGEDLISFRDDLLENVTLHFLPMLNPDGAEVFKRRNAIDIDINRDARRLTSPESVTLKQVRDSLNAGFGFNLHDQSVFYAAGRNENPATISFLAPAYDYEQSENEIRLNAMKLIVHLNSVLQTFIPGQVAKYSDEHEPRAFGDMIQKWGTSTVLIESGGYPGDPEKQFIRKLNFILLLTAADAIGKEAFHDEQVENYYRIPENQSILHDLIIRNVKIEKDESLFEVDLGIRYGESGHAEDGSFRYHGRFSDIGDLSTYYGYDELDGNGLIAKPGKIYEERISGIGELRQINPSALLEQGYTDVVLGQNNFNEEEREFIQRFPLNLVLGEPRKHAVRLGTVPNLILTNDEDGIRYVIVNGFVYDVEKDNVQSIHNGSIDY